MVQEFVQSIKDTMEDVLGGVHTAVPASIESFDAEKGFASVRPKARYKKPSGEKIAFPVISGVPVVFPQSKGAVIAFPIKAGDDCLLVFSESSLDYWMYGKDTDTDLRFDLSNAIAIPSLSRSGSSAMQTACSENAIVLQTGDTAIMVKPDGVQISGNLTVDGELTVSDDATIGGIGFADHTHS